MAKARAAAGPVSITPEALFQAAACHAFSAQLLSMHTHLRLASLRSDKPQRAHGKLTCVPAAIPSVVLAAFSLELYLKCLTLMTGGKFPREHTLQLLFNRLPAIQRITAKHFYDEFFFANGVAATLPPVAPDGSPLDDMYFHFGNVLARASDAFEDWRYYYEEKRDEKCFVCGGLLIYALEKTILRIKPDWQKILDGRGAFPVISDPHT